MWSRVCPKTAWPRSPWPSPSPAWKKLDEARGVLRGRLERDPFDAKSRALLKTLEQEAGRRRPEPAKPAPAAPVVAAGSPKSDAEDLSIPFLQGGGDVSDELSFEYAAADSLAAETPDGERRDPDLDQFFRAGPEPDEDAGDADMLIDDETEFRALLEHEVPDAPEPEAEGKSQAGDEDFPGREHTAARIP
ncbi:MAG: hypothetical protein M5R36_05705 [Deltaproteobacteria bacterium]|nr:hypothetical protein [Deltaproteobacteria bacterium]